MTAQEEALAAARWMGQWKELRIVAARIRNLAQPIALALDDADESPMLAEEYVDPEGLNPQAKDALAQLLALADALAGKGR